MFTGDHVENFVWYYVELAPVEMEANKLEISVPGDDHGAAYWE